MTPTRAHTHHRKGDDDVPTHEQQQSGLMKFLFDYMGMAAFVAAALSWGVLSNRTDNNAEEIRMLRAANEARTRMDVTWAAQGVTKADLQRETDKLAQQIQELSDRMVAPRTQRGSQ